VLASRDMLASSLRGVGRSLARARALSTVGHSGKMSVNGVDLFYRRNGDAGLPLLCLPGSLGTADTDFAPQLSDLADSMQVVSFDPRGYGQSRPPERDFPIDFYERDGDDGAALMAALGHEKYAVMGWSDGAISAVMLAARHAPSVGARSGRASRPLRLVLFAARASLARIAIAHSVGRWRRRTCPKGVTAACETLPRRRWIG
jgi:pimeloyl-ACP methyl ester carboxylesterase